MYKWQRVGWCLKNGPIANFDLDPGVDIMNCVLFYCTGFGDYPIKENRK